MTPAPDPRSDFEAALAELESILRDEPIDAVLARASRLVGSIARAEAVVLFTLEGTELTGCAWHPDPSALPATLHAEMTRAARLAARNETVTPAALESEGSHALRIEPLKAAGRTVALACLAATRDGAASLGTPEVSRLLALLAPRVAAHQEAQRAGALKTQYERWFRTLDEQVRVLDRERQKFAAMVHQTDASVFVTDTSGIIGWTNNVLAAARSPAGDGAGWVGLACRAACGSFGEPGPNAGCTDCPVERALKHNQVAHHELRRMDGEAARNHYLTALPIKGPDGRPQEVMVMIQDLSDLEVLRRSESRYRVLFERSAKAIVMADPTTRRVLLANPMASRMLGSPREELVGMPLELLHAPDEWARLEPHYDLAFLEKNMSAQECRMRARGGVERIATVSGTPADLDGREVLMLEYTDVTQSRHVEQALRAAEERLRTVVSHAPIVMFAIDADGTFTMSEGRGLAALDRKPGEVVGLSVYEVYRDVPELLENVRRALAGEEFTQVVDIGKVAFETRYNPLRDEAGAVVGLIGVATDVTERRRLEEQLRQFQKMEAIGRLAGGVAHDFNNLLAAIMGHSELMLSRIHAGHPLHRNAEEVQKAAARGALLTRQLLSFSRKEVLIPRELDLNLVVGEMDGMLRRLIGEDIELQTRVHDAPLRVRADRGQLEQVIMNLAVNARDALPRGGRLTIEVCPLDLDAAFAQRHARIQAGPHVLLTVSDDGCGMDAQTLQHVFEPFYTTKEQGKGTGLGLSTVYAIIEQAGGHIGVYSEPAMGTSFKVYLPRVEQAFDAPAPERPSVSSLTGSETILLVEDEDAVRAMAREVLETAGYTVLEAHHGPEALAIERDRRTAIDLLVTDVVMPQMSGRELAERLLLVRPGTRVLYMSGYTDDAVVRHGVIEEGTAFIQKPFSLQAFARKVREVLDAAPRPGGAMPDPRSAATWRGPAPEPGRRPDASAA